MRLTHSLKRTCGVPSPGPISPASHINLHGYLSAIPGTTEIGAKSFLEFYNRSASCPSVSSSGENTQFILAHTTSGKVCNLQHYSPSSPTYNRAKNNNKATELKEYLADEIKKLDSNINIPIIFVRESSVLEDSLFDCEYVETKAGNNRFKRHIYRNAIEDMIELKKTLEN